MINIRFFVLVVHIKSFDGIQSNRNLYAQAKQIVATIQLLLIMANACSSMMIIFNET